MCTWCWVPRVIDDRTSLDYLADQRNEGVVVTLLNMGGGYQGRNLQWPTSGGKHSDESDQGDGKKRKRIKQDLRIWGWRKASKSYLPDFDQQKDKYVRRKRAGIRFGVNEPTIIFNNSEISNLLFS